VNSEEYIGLDVHQATISVLRMRYKRFSRIAWTFSIPKFRQVS
jgi:hypothetical protein